MPIFVPITLITLALVALVVVFLTSGDAATGLGRAGWTAIGIAGACLLGLLITMVRRRTLLGFNGIAFLILLVFFGIVGLTGILVEPPLHTVQANNLKKEGKYEQSIMEYRLGLDKDLGQNLAESYLLWGDKLLKDKDFEQAIARYRQAISPEYGNSRFKDTARKKLGITYLEWGLYLENVEQKPDEALKKYDSVVEDGINTDAIDKARYQAQGIIYRVGDQQFEAGDYEKALTTYKNAIDLYGGAEADLKPYISKTYLTWGQKLIAGGDYQKALEKLDLQYAYGNDVGAYNLATVECYVGIGKGLMSEQKYDELFNVLSKAFTQYGRYDSKSQIQGMLGDSMIQQATSAENNKETAKAIEFYEKALNYVVNKADVTTNLKSKLNTLHLQLGDEQFGQNQFEQALTTYSRALRLYPNPSTAGQFRTSQARTYFSWAQQAENEKNFQAALDRYRLILASYGDQVEFTRQASDAQPRVLLSLAQKLSADKNYDGAIARYQELVDKFGLTSQGVEAKNTLQASQDVVVTVLDRNGRPLTSLKVKLDEGWKKTSNGFEPTGKSMDFTTNSQGQFTIKLAPGKAWMLSYYKNGSYAVASFGEEPANLVRSLPLRTTNQNQSVLLP
jgi:tetratricopeptide (TPR) repeat protein